MSKRNRTLSLGLLAAALLLAALAQSYFLRRPEYVWDGVVFAGLSVLCFLLAGRLEHAAGRATVPAASSRPSWDGCLRRHPAETALAGLSLALSLAAGLLARGRAWNQPAWAPATLWLLGILALVVCALWPGNACLPDPRLALRRVRESLRSMGRAARLEIIAVAGLTLLALVLRVAALGRVPFTLGGDEAWHGLLARQVLHGELRNPFVMGYMSMPTLFYWPLGASLALFGDNMLGLRFPAVLIGTLSVPLLYLLARRLWGWRVAFLGAGFLATYDYHVHYSRLGANNVWDALFAILTLWLLDRAMASETSRGERDASRGRRAGGVAAGLVLGLAFYFYTGARLLPAVVVLYLAYLWLRGRLSRDRAPSEGLGAGRLAWLLLAFLVAAAPMLGYALAHPNEWNARLNQVGILQSGWLAREPGLTGKSTIQILAEQFLRAAGAFHVFPDRTTWYGATRPLLGFLAGVLALLGMAWAAARWRERRHALLLLWFWAVIISGGMLTESPPSSQRLVMAAPAVALLVAIGLERTVRLAWRLLRLEPRRADALLGLLLLVLALGNLRAYFLEFTPTRRYGSENGETATMAGYYLRSLRGEVDVYLLGAPRLYWSFGTMEFLAPNARGHDLVEPLQAPPERQDPAGAAVFLFLPERAEELAWVQQAFPDGRVREFHDRVGRLRFTAYEVP